MAELDHWVDRLPEEVVGEKARKNHRSNVRARRPHILEVEHWSVLTGPSFSDWRSSFVYWGRVLAERQRADERVRTDACKGVLALSRGSVDHFRQFLSPDTWGKLDYVFPAVPAQPQPKLEGSSREAFTVLTIGNRFSVKGIPEALKAFETLRKRHGPKVRMVLVSKGIPHDCRLTEGIMLYDTFRMSPKLKADLFSCADVLVELSYLDSLIALVEATAFGLPAITTRIHHGEDFVREGENGYLVESPLIAYGEHYGTRWKSLLDFRAELQVMREGGGLDSVVEDVVDRLELMVSGDSDLEALRKGARRMHAQRFSPEVRNARLNAIYARALGQ